MDFSIVASIIVSLISVICSFVVVYLSAIRDVFNEKQQVRREQLDNFYVPFYRRYCAGFLFRNRLSQMSLEARNAFLDLLTRNIYLMEPTSQAKYSDFYAAYLDLLEAENGNEDYSLVECSDRFDQVFNDMTTSILLEYKCILKKCHLPVPLI